MTDAPVVHMRVLNDGPMPADLSVAINADVRTSDQRAPAPASDARPGSTDAVAPADVPGSGSWTIEAGDHLWHVAESTVTRVLGRPAPAATTLAYLDLLIDSNRARLVVADNADLVFPGQIFTLPSVPPALLVT